MTELTASSAPTYTLIAEDLGVLISAVPIESGKLRTGRLFQGAGASIVKLSFDAEQIMTEHSAAVPILVQVLEGHITFSVDGDDVAMRAGSIIHVASRVPHSLEAHEPSHVLLTLCSGNAAGKREPRTQPETQAGRAGVEQQTGVAMEAAAAQLVAAGAKPELTLSLTERQHQHSASNDERCECGVVDEPVLPALDVRPIPHAIRHATVFGALDSIADGTGMTLVAHHDPLPLLAQIAQRYPGRFTVEYRERGPEAWRLDFLAAQA